jgi:hypothetical protein
MRQAFVPVISLPPAFLAIVLSLSLAGCSSSERLAVGLADANVRDAATAPPMATGGTPAVAGEADAGRPSPAVVLDAGARDTGTPDTGPAVRSEAGTAPLLPSLPTAYFTLKNESAGTIWHGGGSGCDYTWLTIQPAHPVPVSAVETQALQDIQAELSCICDCAMLGAGDVCTRAKCPERFGCTTANWSAPIASGQALEGDIALFTTELDVDRKCIAQVGYAVGTELIARFCYSLDELDILATRCEDVPFRSGDRMVTCRVDDLTEDAGP